MKVRIVVPKSNPNRKIQLVYKDPKTGKLVCVSSGTRDPKEATEEAEKLKARLVLGISAKAANAGPHMPWQAFRELYRNRHLVELRRRSMKTMESRLSICESIAKPDSLSDMAARDSLVKIRQELLASDRSAHTVKGLMTCIVAALRWAEAEGLIDAVPRVPAVRTARLKKMKGRPITTEEFERMCNETPKVVGADGAASWLYLLRGLWASGLRLGEIMAVSWDDDEQIRPLWRGRRSPILSIPSSLQKNDTEEEIPLIPWFESVLLETAKADRHGWAFEPASLEPTHGRLPRSERMQSEWVGKIVSRIGKAAKVVVSKKPLKYASAHDLRRGCAQRLEDAGVPIELVSRIMRHQSTETTRRHYAPGRVQVEARRIREILEV